MKPKLSKFWCKEIIPQTLVPIVVSLILVFQTPGLLSYEFEDEQSQVRLSTEISEPNPIEKLFGSGYICLHISDPKYASSPAFQALARELSKQYNKPTQVYEVGSNKTTKHHEHLHEDTDTIVVDIQEPVTKKPPPKVSLIKQKATKCLAEGYFVDPNNCTRYYRCYHMGVAKGGSNKATMTKTFYDCGPGTMFNEHIQACDHPLSIPKDQKCVKPDIGDQGVKGLRGQEPEPFDEKGVKGLRGGGDEEPEPIEQTHSQPPPDDDDQFPDQTDADKEWVPQLPSGADDEIERLHNLPKEDDDIEQITQQEEEPGCTDPGTYAHPTICRKFYQCVRVGGQLEMRMHDCPNGQIFVEEDEECRPKTQIPTPTPCMRRRSRKRTEVDEQVSEIIDYEEAIPEEQIEHVDSEESSFITQEITTPEKRRKHHNRTVIHEESSESVEEGQHIPGQRGSRRKKLPAPPAGPKPNAKCTREGNFIHPTDCSKYFRCERRGPAIRIFHSTCTPEGTLFDEKTSECKTPRELSKPIPECAKWDKKYRKVYEDIINEETIEIDESQVKGEDIEQEETKWDEQEPAKYTDDEYEEIVIEDEHGNKRKVRRKKTRHEIHEEFDEEITTDEEKKQGIKGSGKRRRKPVDQEPVATDDIEQVHSKPPEEDDVEDEKTSTIEPPFTKTETWVTGSEEDEEKGVKGLRGGGSENLIQTTTLPPPPDCSDDLALIETLRQERDAALERVNTLEKENAKLEKQLKKAKKDLDAAVKAKQSMSDYMKNLDKTVDSYKKDVERLKLCCPSEQLIGEDESDDFNVKGRKKRSVDTSEYEKNPFDEYLEKPVEEEKVIEDRHHRNRLSHKLGHRHNRRHQFESESEAHQRFSNETQEFESNISFLVLTFTCVLLSILLIFFIGLSIVNRLKNRDKQVNYTLESIKHYLRDRESGNFTKHDSNTKYKNLDG